MSQSQVLFLESVNVEITLSPSIMGFIEAHQEERDFGREKLIGLAAGIKFLRLSSSRIIGHVIGPNSEWLALIVIEIATILQFDSVSVSHSEYAELRTNSSNDHNFVADSGCDEADNIVLIRDYLQKTSPETIFFASRFQDRFRHDASLSAREQRSRLQTLGFRPLALSYFAIFAKGILAHGIPCDRKLSPKDQERCLFVVGHARSGSSLMFHMLNEMSDVLISYEANLDIPKNRHSLIENYNRIQRMRGRPISKGFYLPTLLAASGGVADVFEGLLSHYALVGDKMAFGARNAWYEQHPAERVFEFLMEWFPFCRFIITLRSPGAGIAAMARMRGDLSIAMLFDFWLGGIIQMIDLVAVSGQAVICLYERLIAGDLKPAEWISARDLSPTLELIENGEITTDEDAVRKFWAEQDRASLALLDRLSNAYGKLGRLIDPSTGRYSGPASRKKLWDVRATLSKEYAELLQKELGSGC